MPQVDDFAASFTGSLTLDVEAVVNNFNGFNFYSVMHWSRTTATCVNVCFHTIVSDGVGVLTVSTACFFYDEHRLDSKAAP